LSAINVRIVGNAKSLSQVGALVAIFIATETRAQVLRRLSPA
jgi:hypothetical protein